MRPADPGVVGDLERILSPDRVLSRPIDRLGRSADASIYRLIPEAIVRPRSVGEIRDLLAWATPPRPPPDVPGRGHLALGPGGERRRPRRDRPVLPRGARARRRGAGLDAAGGDRRPPEPPPRRPPDPHRPRPGLDRRGDGRRHPRQQLLRDVLRRRAEQLPHARLAPRAARRRRRGRHRAARRRRGAPAGAAGAPRRAPRAARRDPPRRGPRRPHPPQVLHEEHERLQPQRLRGLRPARGHPRPPHGGLGGDARLRGRDDLPHRPRAARAGDRPRLLRRPRGGRGLGGAARRGGGGRARDPRRRLAALRLGRAPAARSRSRGATRRSSSSSAGWTRRRSPRRRATPRRSSSGYRLLEPPRFTTGEAERAALWHVRKGLAARTGAMRPTGTAFLTEDVAVPVARLAEAILDCQALFERHGVPDTVIFGHAKDGNLHFVMAEDVRSPEAVERYGAFIQGLVDLVVNKYDGAIKAEHGAGRNMAPFVRTEWGDRAYGVMERVKRMLDPDGILNPGVKLNPNPRAHLESLKPCPTISPLADRCTECGFCESRCPSRDLTLTPRQRIVVTRELTRLRASTAPADREWAEALEADFAYEGVDDLRRGLDVPGRVPGEDRHRRAREGAEGRGAPGVVEPGRDGRGRELLPRRGGGPGRAWAPPRPCARCRSGRRLVELASEAAHAAGPHPRAPGARAVSRCRCPRWPCRRPAPPRRRREWRRPPPGAASSTSRAASPASSAPCPARTSCPRPARWTRCCGGPASRCACPRASTASAAAWPSPARATPTPRGRRPARRPRPCGARRAAGACRS